jgi:hypothetical protein
VKETYKTTELEGESGIGNKKNPSTLFKREEDPAK